MQGLNRLPKHFLLYTLTSDTNVYNCACDLAHPHGAHAWCEISRQDVGTLLQPGPTADGKLQPGHAAPRFGGDLCFSFSGRTDGKRGGCAGAEAQASGADCYLDKERGGPLDQVWVFGG